MMDNWTKNLQSYNDILAAFRLTLKIYHFKDRRDEYDQLSYTYFRLFYFWMFRI